MRVEKDIFFVELQAWIDNVMVDREAEQILSDHIPTKYAKVMVHQGNDHSSREQAAVLQSSISVNRESYAKL